MINRSVVRADGNRLARSRFGVCGCPAVHDCDFKAAVAADEGAESIALKLCAGRVVEGAGEAGDGVVGMVSALGLDGEMVASVRRQLGMEPSVTGRRYGE